MKLFQHAQRQRSKASRDLYARFELLYTFVDFSAALCFLVGSTLFFRESLMTPATWLFVVGSLLFAAKPTLRLLREVRLYRMGDYADLAERLED